MKKIISLFYLLTFVVKIQALEVPISDDISLPGSRKSGQKAELIVGGNKKAKAYVKFNTSELLFGLTSSNISKANLTFFVSSLKQPGKVTVSSISSSWKETDTTAPQTSSNFSTQVQIDSGNKFITVDVTSYIKAAMDNGLTSFQGFAFDSLDAFLKLDSKENKKTSHPVKLEIMPTVGSGSIYVTTYITNTTTTIITNVLTLTNLPQAFSCQAYSEAGFTIPTVVNSMWEVGGGTSIPFNFDYLDEFNMHNDSMQTDRFYMPESGVYMFHVNVEWSANTAGTPRGIFILKYNANGTPVSLSEYVGWARSVATPEAAIMNGRLNTPLTCIDRLTKGQYIRVFAMQNSGMDLSIFRRTISIHWISR